MKNPLAKKSSSRKPLSIVARPSHDAISTKAQQLWEKKGYPEGCDEATWLEAERLLSSHNPGFDGDREMSELNDLFPGSGGQETTAL